MVQLMPHPAILGGFIVGAPLFFVGMMGLFHIVGENKNVDHLKENVDYMTWAIRSAIAGLIVILLALVGWLATNKDKAMVDILNEIKATQSRAIEESAKRDAQVMDSVAKLCERQGALEGRVNTIEFSIMIPFQQRLELFKGNGTKKK
jgi:hypothetical protein